MVSYETCNDTIDLGCYSHPFAFQLMTYGSYIF